MKRLLLILALLLHGSAIFGQDVCISSISVKGNSITSESVILREVPFCAGDTINSPDFEKMLVESRQNLLNTSLFNYVTIGTHPSGNSGTGMLDVEIEVEERWYIWPIFEMRFNDRNMSSWIKKMDWKRVTFYSGVKISNMFGLGHKLEVRGMSGWEKGLDMSYSKVALDSRKTSYLAAEAYAMFYKNADVLTQRNKPQHYSGEGYMKRSYGGSLVLTYRPQIRWRASAGISYDFSKIAQEVLDANPEYWGVRGRISRTFALNAMVCRDERDYIIYPTQGMYASLSMKLEESNGFDFNYGQFLFDFQYYRKFSQRWMASSSVKLSTSFSNRYSYSHSKAIGYEIANITGYELFVADGQHYITQNNSIKYLIMPQKIVQLGKNPRWRKFNKPHFTIYGKFLFDFGYVFQKKDKVGDNNYSNSFLAGAGFGLDLLTYYDIVINVGYSVNNRGKGSFLFGFRAPIF